jgi:hypothetical protein
VFFYKSTRTPDDGSLELFAIKHADLVLDLHKGNKYKPEET